MTCESQSQRLTSIISASPEGDQESLSTGKLQFPSLHLLIWEVGFLILYISTSFSEKPLKHILIKHCKSPKVPLQSLHMGPYPETNHWGNKRVPSGIIISYLNTSLNLLRWRLPEDERVAFRHGRTHRTPVTINNASIMPPYCLDSTHIRS